MLTKEFFETIFGDNTGYLILATKDDNGNLTNNTPFKYPAALNAVVRYVEMRTDIDVWFSPMLYSGLRRNSSMVANTPVIYADTDEFDPAQFKIAPSLNVITSENPLKRHSYWLLDGEYSPHDVSTAARAIALTHASKDVDGNQAGVDPSGWDLTQLLRVPGTKNRKFETLKADGSKAYPQYSEPQDVFVENFTGEIYSLEDITTAYDPSNLPKVVRTLPSKMSESLPPAAEVLNRVMNDSKLKQMYTHEPRTSEDRSELMYNFCSEMFRCGFTPEEVVVAAWGTAYNKYRLDNRTMDELWRYDVSNAASDPENAPRSTTERVGEDGEVVKTTTPTATQLATRLLSDEERSQVSRTFVDEYAEWLAEITDAPIAYHIAGAITILSCVLGEWAYARPSYGKVPLGMFFIIMGETTKTRKSTSRKKVKQMLRLLEVGDYSYMLTSDVTPESLLDDLSERPYLSSLYDRDEAQQLIADVKGGRGYMKGFFETLNDLYDGVARGRSRTTKKTKEAEVVFIQYAMGIRSQIQENLALEDFASGYLVRNCFVYGENSHEEEMPGQGSLGPDTVAAELADKLSDVRGWWARKVGSREDKHALLFSEDAWTRLWAYKQDLETLVADHPRGNVLSACVSRLYENTMRVACLFAMYRKASVVEMQDVINAMIYSMEWFENLIVMVEGVTESGLQRNLDKIIEFIEKGKGLVTVTSLKRWAAKAEGWDEHTLRNLIATATEAGYIEEVADGRGHRCYTLT